MRTNIDIDDKLMRAAMKATGAPTKKGAVEAALRRLVEIRAAEADRKEFVRRRRGKEKEALAPEDDWLEKWLATGWEQTQDRAAGLRGRRRKTNAH